MKRKLYIIILTLLAILVFSSYTFAANNIAIVDGVRNVVGGAENAVENAGKDIVDGVRNVTSSSENTMDNVTSKVKTQTQNVGNKIVDSATDDYSAIKTTTRTSADATTGTFLGMNSTVWTWLIMTVVGIAIIALVWIYAKQNNRSYND